MPVAVTRPIPRPLLLRVVRRIVTVVAVGLGLGAVSGIVWWAITPLPSYVVQDDGYAAIGERGLVQVFAADAYFALLGVVVGVMIGVLTARLLARRLGWLAALVVVLTSTAAALVCWWVGSLLGPGNFADRLVAASSGEAVPIDLTLRSGVAIVVWPFLGLLPVLLWATLVPDPQEPRPLSPPWRGWQERRTERRSVAEAESEAAAAAEPR